MAGTGGSSAGRSGGSGGVSTTGGAPEPGGAAGEAASSAGGAGGDAAGEGGTGARDGGAAGEVDAAGGTSGTGDSSTAGEAGTPSIEGGAAGEGAGTSPDGALFHVTVARASDIDPVAPGTVGIVTFAVDVPGLSRARVEFGPTRGYGMTAPVDLGEPELRTLLLGMKPSRTYHFRIVVEDATRAYTSNDYTLFTGPPTTAVPVPGFRVIDPAARQPGFLIASYWIGAGSGVPFILDRDGEIVWWYTGLSGGIGRARISEDGKNLWLAFASNSGAPLRRIRMDALESESYPQAVASHDITPVRGSTMAYIEYGEPDCDSIFEIDPTGTQHEVFESEGVVQSNAPPLRCHGNALRYSASADLYTFSEWHQDVFALTRAGEIVWRLSELVSGGNMAWGGAQHGHHLLSDSLLVFANLAEPSRSQAIEYLLDGSEKRRFTSGGYSANFGDVQRLPGGNTLVTYSNAGQIEEIDDSDQVVLEIDTGDSRLGYVSWRETLYGEVPDSTD
ncbi:MAG TPA: hypothetical protein VGK73_19325 [Polyangiaceae bacterium]